LIKEFKVKAFYPISRSVLFKIYF